MRKRVSNKQNSYLDNFYLTIYSSCSTKEKKNPTFCYATIAHSQWRYHLQVANSLLNGPHSKETSPVIQRKWQSDKSTICFPKHKVTQSDKTSIPGSLWSQYDNARNNVKHNIDICCLQWAGEYETMWTR